MSAVEYEQSDTPRSGLTRAKVVAGDAETTEAILVDRFPCSVSVEPAGGASGKLQYTLSKFSEIRSGSAVWFDWTKGASGVVNVNTTNFCVSPVSAFRAVSIFGTITLRVVF